MLHSLSLPWVICARWACCEGKEEEGRRRKEESDVPPVRVCCVYRGSTPGPLRCVLPSPHLPSRGPCGLQQGRDSKREPEHATAHHHPQHSATLHSLSSPPRPPSLARTKRAQTHTNPRKPPPHNHARPCPRGQIGQWGEREGARKKTPFPGPQTPPYLTRAGWAGWGSTQEGQGANFPEGGGRPPPGAGTLSPIYIQIRP